MTYEIYASNNNNNKQTIVVCMNSFSILHVVILKKKTQLRMKNTREAIKMIDAWNQHPMHLMHVPYIKMHVPCIKCYGYSMNKCI